MDKYKIVGVELPDSRYNIVVTFQDVIHLSKEVDFAGNTWFNESFLFLPSTLYVLISNACICFYNSVFF